MPFLTKKHLSRRTFLRGAGAAVALPWLEAMLPAVATRAQAAAALTPPQRFVAVNYGLGFHGPNLFPKEAGADYKPTPYLEALADVRTKFSVISGLSHPDQNGANGHTSELTILTAAKHPGLPGFKNTISLDQFLVEKLVPDVRFPSLQLSVGGNDSLSWSASGVNLPAEQSPEKIFKQLFVNGTKGEVYNQLAELKRGRSILDTINERARALHKTLGARDQEKFDQYLTSVRELESRLQASSAWAEKPKPTIEREPPKDIADRLEVMARSRLMHEMIVLALQTDSTRFVTLKSSATGDVPKIPGVDTGWHDLSHHGQDKDKIDELARIERAEFGEINHFLKLLDGAKEAGGAVLDRTSVLFTSNLGNASSHSWRDLPVVLAGGGFKHGTHVVAGPAGHDNARYCNLFVQIAQRMGADVESFGSSNGTAVPGLA
ncbi:MAG: DUF1552 domain-containing protein [Pirellulales bacterium]